MNYWLIISGWICFTTLFISALIFIITSIYEQEKRATIRGIFIFSPTLIIFAAILLLNYQLKDWIIFSLLSFTFLAILIILIPKNKTESLKIPGKQTKVDECDALFHRFSNLKSGTPEFDEYYSKYPEKLDFDNEMRAMPNLGEPGSRTYHRISSLFQEVSFNSIDNIRHGFTWQPEVKPLQGNPEVFTTRIKGFAKYLGAKLVGITILNQAYIYSNSARTPGKWGEPIRLNHKYAIAIAVEMSHDMVKHAPENPTTTETAFKYYEVAKIATLTARFINKLGYEAQAHVDGYYKVMCIPIAAAAGLGELGRLGLLVTPEFGPRIRLAIVTTNIPLVPDKPISFGVQHFCTFCKKCATACPSNSIETGKKKIYAGVEKWQSDQDNCYKFWRKQGTDCGICIKVCPYSNPNTFIHNVIRWVIQRNNLSRRLAFLGDEFFYGNRLKNKFKLPDWHKSV